MNARQRAWVGIVLLALAVGCRGETQVPEAGALLLRVGLAAGAPVPDELRLSAYDDSGPLWTNARFPAEGPLVAQSASFLGTILIQPGTTVGDLRIDLRGISGQAVADEGTLIVTPAERANATFDLTLSTALPSDADGDGVPDPIDDCPALPDPAQSGCGRDAGAGGSAGGPDASGGHSGTAGGGGQPGTGGQAGTPGSGGAAGATGTGGQAGAAGKGGSAGTGGSTGGTGGTTGSGGQAGSAGSGGRGGAAGTPGTGGQTGGAGGGGLPQGTTCTAASQCASGFCKDGACCNNACTGACNSCATGTCTMVDHGQDAPECVAPMSCNKAGKCVGS
jgi:hypothetical protein